MAQINTDIIIVGAGLVGLAAAIALAKQNKRVVLIDAKKQLSTMQSAWDERVYALTPESESWLKVLDVWRHVESSRVNAIHAMHLWGGSDDPLILSDKDANLLKLGVIIENQNLMYALWQQIGTLDVTVITGVNCEFLQKEDQYIQLALQGDTKITAKLIIAADGVNSWVRQQVNIAVKEKSFNQTAIVANFSAEKNHQNIARQWFLPHETLALLPLPNQMVSMVWSLSTKKANELLRVSKKDLANKVEFQTKYELGPLELVGEVLSFTLTQQTATQLIAERVVLIGDAAHQIHPMAGQGVNLGFRDVMELQNLLSTSHALQDIGEYSFLRNFERARIADIATMNTLATWLDYLFADESGAVKKTINWGLQQLNHQTTLKKLLIQQVASISY